MQLVDWVNDLAGTHHTKVEQLCSGHAYCRIFVDLFPGTLNMKRVKESATFEIDKISNLKVLQKAFMTVKVDKTVPIEALVRAKYQDNLEFVQWFRKFHEANGGDRMPSVEPTTASRPTSSGKPKSQTAPVATRRATGGGPIRTATTATPTTTTVVREVDPALIEENTKLKQEAEKVKGSLLALEKERDFYFNKLLTVEGICQAEQDTAPGNELITRILAILYETDDGFAPPQNPDTADVDDANNEMMQDVNGEECF
ncbi:hypothetical protein SARC_03533 [Sphaeroforma arctica JP610]|uniref:EB1 C-terminal domain-containing protein n=1 Tax=Sphaeroforma arctica JP610 TaxID=667725 RepID=A0A0L0G5B5_9EUKA|nr:hypothetical protein SARC_03533 [Sphaeroforma arctica JP610]KNC84232.1 hypothetical protein SARC_03533 [Sphaeroforma arctica JP610]|eukprot:XP_014158134.1 hypothetical protein SARC_03533 [Sphaeroforma arctica JP610]